MNAILGFLTIAQKIWGIEVTQALYEAFKSKLNLLKLTPEEIARLDSNYNDLKAIEIKNRQLAGGV